MLIRPREYHNFLIDDNTTEVQIPDHLGGFNSRYQSPVLDRVINQAGTKPVVVITEYIVDHRIRDRYPTLDFRFDYEEHRRVLDHFTEYTMHPERSFDNLVCSFNGSAHVGRQLLVSALHKLNLFDPAYCSKNFASTADQITGHIVKYVGDEDRYYNKFLVSTDAEFNQSIYSFGHDRYNHSQNIHTLENPLTQSFVQIVSETRAEDYYPFYGEKFLYSVVTRGLFVAHGQPGWHAMLETCYGFKSYSRVFDYRFDSVLNPIDRLLELMTMISRFRNLSASDLSDLYQLESETLEYNYDHYFSGNYLKCLEKFR